jgi:hypothetical protein
VLAPGYGTADEDQADEVPVDLVAADGDQP